MKIERLLEEKGRNVVTLSSIRTVADLLTVLASNNIGAVVIVSADNPEQIVGIVSERDVVRALSFGGRVLGAPVTTISTKIIVTCSVSHDVVEVMEMMTDSRVRHVPVLSDENKLVGIISIGDVVKNHISSIETEREQLQNYIMS